MARALILFDFMTIAFHKLLILIIAQKVMIVALIVKKDRTKSKYLNSVQNNAPVGQAVAYDINKGSSAETELPKTKI